MEFSTQGEEPFDACLSSCCIKDAQEQRKAAALLSILREHDPARQAVEARLKAGAILPSPPHIDGDAGCPCSDCIRPSVEPAAETDGLTDDESDDELDDDELDDDDLEMLRSFRAMRLRQLQGERSVSTLMDAESLKAEIEKCSGLSVVVVGSSGDSSGHGCLAGMLLQHLQELALAPAQLERKFLRVVESSTAPCSWLASIAGLAKSEMRAPMLLALRNGTGAVIQANVVSVLARREFMSSCSGMESLGVFVDKWLGLIEAKYCKDKDSSEASREQDVLRFCNKEGCTRRFHHEHVQRYRKDNEWVGLDEFVNFCASGSEDDRIRTSSDSENDYFFGD